MRIFCEENEYEFEDILDDITFTRELFGNDAKTLRVYRRVVEQLHNLLNRRLKPIDSKGHSGNDNVMDWVWLIEQEPPYIRRTTP